MIFSMDRIAMQSAKPGQKTQRAGGSCDQAAGDSRRASGNFSKGYWDRVVNRLSYLEVDDVLELVVQPGRVHHKYEVLQFTRLQSALACGSGS